MKLTPLKVRCKRRLPGEPKHLPRQLKKRKVGRMEQSLSQHAAAQKQKRGSPLLDKLPTELLERIFVESGNVNLTRASHILGARLSSKAVFMRMIQRAFAPTWDEWFGCISLEVGEYTDAYGDADRFSGSPQEQSEILGFRWAKVPLLLEAQQRWLENQPRKVRQERRFQHLADFYKVPRRIIRRHQHVGTNHVDSVHECYRVDFEAHIHRLTVLTPADTYREGQNRLCLLDMHPRVRIPDCLLTGPYGEDEVHLLFWLVRGGTRIAAQQSWELTRQGFDHILMDVASLDHVAILIHMFGMLDVFLTRWPKSVFEQAVARVAELAQDESHERIAIFQYIRAYFKRVTDVRANIQLMYEPKPESEYYYTESESEEEDVGDDEADQDIDDAATDISPPSQVASETTQSADAASVAPSYTSIFSPAASTAATSSARTSISEGSLADPSSSKTVWASGAMSSGWFNEPSAS